MRLHSNIITSADIHKALNECITTGTIAPQVNFKALTQHKSQTHKRAFEIQLEAASRKPGDGRRAGNSGSYGASANFADPYGSFAATYDEWGWLIAALYSIDPDAVWGSVKRPTYANRDAFDHLTGLTYNPAVLLAYLNAPNIDQGGGDPYPYQHKAQVGRYGAGRKSADDVYPGWDVYRPRTAEWVRSFAHLTDAAVSA